MVIFAGIMYSFLVYAQRIDVQQIFAATSEEEMYKFYDQMIDSARLSNRFIHSDDSTRPFNFGFFEEIESKDTLIKFVQECWVRRGDYICARFYWIYLSNNMPIDFYGRLLDYFRDVKRRENYFLKIESIKLLDPIIRIIIKKYESGILDEQDSIKALQLIEETLLRLINDAHDYTWLLSHKYTWLLIFDKYITDNIRQALVRVIENPFYPEEYLDFYLSQQDTTVLDTIGIPANIRPQWRPRFTPEELQIYEEELPLFERLQRFLRYERIGREEYGGLSAGQAYLRRRQDGFGDKGYLNIRYIEDYAYHKNDELLIKHLKEFKIKHPDYPLRYF